MLMQKELNVVTVPWIHEGKSSSWETLFHIVNLVLFAETLLDQI